MNRIPLDFPRQEALLSLKPFIMGEENTQGVFCDESESVSSPLNYSRKVRVKIDYQVLIFGT